MAYPIPAIWQAGHVNTRDWPYRYPDLGYSDLYLFPAVILPELERPLVEHGNAIHSLLLSMHNSSHNALRKVAVIQDIDLSIA